MKHHQQVNSGEFQLDRVFKLFSACCLNENQGIINPTDTHTHTHRFTPRSKDGKIIEKYKGLLSF